MAEKKLSALPAEELAVIVCAAAIPWARLTVVRQARASRGPDNYIHVVSTVTSILHTHAQFTVCALPLVVFCLGGGGFGFCLLF